MPGTLGHLTRRFFDVIAARPLDLAETETVAHWLDDAALLTLFLSQADADQRHGYSAALHMIGVGFEDPDLVATALLHDVGKTESRLGLIGRSVASILIKTGMPLSERMIDYRDHGPIGAGILEQIGAPAVCVEFARAHHESRPISIPPEVWDALQTADQPNPRPVGTPG